MLWDRARSASAAAGTLEAAGFPGAGHTAGFRGAAGVVEPTDAADGAAVVGEAQSPDAADVSGSADISRYSFLEKKKGSKAINEFNSATTVGRYNKCDTYLKRNCMCGLTQNQEAFQ